MRSWRHAVHGEIHENEAREPFWGGRHPYLHPGEMECCYIPVNCRKDLETVFVEVALLSELQFKHQVTTARGEGGTRRRGA